MASIPKAKFEFQEYVLFEDRALPESEQTKWRVRCLSVDHKAEVLDKRNTDATAALLAFKYGCFGWANLLDNGTPLPFDGLVYNSDGLARVHPKFLSDTKGAISIPFEWQLEIGTHIIKLSFISESEKN